MRSLQIVVSSSSGKEASFVLVRRSSRQMRMVIATERNEKGLRQEREKEPLIHFSFSLSVYSEYPLSFHRKRRGLVEQQDKVIFSSVCSIWVDVWMASFGE